MIPATGTLGCQFNRWASPNGKSKQNNIIGRNMLRFSQKIIGSLNIAIIFLCSYYWLSSCMRGKSPIFHFRTGAVAPTHPIAKSFRSGRIPCVRGNEKNLSGGKVEDLMSERVHARRRFVGLHPIGGNDFGEVRLQAVAAHRAIQHLR